MSRYLPRMDGRRMRAWMAGSVLALGLVALQGAHAQGTAPTAMRPMMGHAGMGEAMGPGLMRGHGLERMLDAVKATDSQKAQIRQIAEAARRDLTAQHESGRALHQQGLRLFAQPTLDAAAMESLRQQMAAQRDQASRRMGQAVLEIGKVLSPEQRKTLVEQMQKREAMAERHARERRELLAPPAGR